MSIDLGRSVTYAFEDKQWPKKVGVLFLVGLVPGLNLILWHGYAMTVAHNIQRRRSAPLPDWTNWSDIAIRGLLGIVATLLYLLPALFLFCCLWVIVPFFLGTDRQSLLTAVQCVTAFFVLIYMSVVGMLLCAGHVRYAQTDQFSSYLELGARFGDLQKTPGTFFGLFLILALLGLITALVAGVLAITCVGAVAVLTLAALASGYLLGSVSLALTARPAARR